MDERQKNEHRRLIEAGVFPSDELYKAYRDSDLSTQFKKHATMEAKVLKRAMELKIDVLTELLDISEKKLDKAVREKKEANQFIKDMIEAIGMDNDGIGFDGLQISISDVEEYINDMGWIVKTDSPDKDTTIDVSEWNTDNCVKSGDIEKDKE